MVLKLRNRVRSELQDPKESSSHGRENQDLIIAENASENPLMKLQKEELKNNAFQYLLNLTIILGIPLNVASDKSTAKRYCCAVFVIRLVTLIIFVLEGHKLLRGFEMKVSFNIFNCICFIIYLDMIFKRRKIYSTIQMLTNHLRKISPDATVGSKSIKLELSALISTAIMITLFSLICTYQYWNIFTNDIRVPFIESHTSQPVYIIFIVIVLVINYSMNMVTYLSALLYCRSAFITTSLIINAFSLKLVKSVTEKCDFPTLNKNIDGFVKVCKVMAKVNKAFSASTCLILGTCVLNIFFNISILFSQHPLMKSSVSTLYAWMSVGGSSIVCWILIMSGIKVQTSSENLMMDIETCSLEIVKYSDNASLTQMYNLLMNNIRGFDLSVSAYGLVTIKRRLIFSILGLVISYSFLLFNFSEK